MSTRRDPVLDDARPSGPWPGQTVIPEFDVIPKAVGAASVRVFDIEDRLAHRPPRAGEARQLAEAHTDLRAALARAEADLGRPVFPRLADIVEANLDLDHWEQRAVITTSSASQIVPSILGRELLDGLHVVGGFADATPRLEVLGRGIGQYRTLVMTGFPTFEVVAEGAAVTGAPTFTYVSAQTGAFEKRLAVFSFSHELIEDGILQGSDVVRAASAGMGASIDAQVAAKLLATTTLPEVPGTGSIDIGEIVTAINALGNAGHNVEDPRRVRLVVSPGTRAALRAAQVTATWKLDDFCTVSVSPSLDDKAAYVFVDDPAVLHVAIRSRLQLDVSARGPVGFNTDTVSYRAAFRSAVSLGDTTGIVKIEVP